MSCCSATSFSSLVARPCSLSFPLSESKLRLDRDLFRDREVDRERSYLRRLFHGLSLDFLLSSPRSFLIVARFAAFRFSPALRRRSLRLSVLRDPPPSHFAVSQFPIRVKWKICLVFWWQRSSQLSAPQPAFSPPPLSRRIAPSIPAWVWAVGLYPCSGTLLQLLFCFPAFRFFGVGV